MAGDVNYYGRKGLFLKFDGILLHGIKNLIEYVVHGGPCAGCFVRPYPAQSVPEYQFSEVSGHC